MLGETRAGSMIYVSGACPSTSTGSTDICASVSEHMISSTFNACLISVFLTRGRRPVITQNAPQ